MNVYLLLRFFHRANSRSYIRREPAQYSAVRGDEGGIAGVLGRFTQYRAASERPISLSGTRRPNGIGGDGLAGRRLETEHVDHDTIGSEGTGCPRGDAATGPE